MSKSVEIDKFFEKGAVRVDLTDKGAVVIWINDGALTIEACNHKTLDKEKFHIKLSELETLHD